MIIVIQVLNTKFIQIYLQAFMHISKDEYTQTCLKRPALKFDKTECKIKNI
jgi:hypothetical protein